MRKIVAVAVALLAVGCGAQSTPCTTCPSISGVYSVKSNAVEADMSTCGTVSYGGYTGDLTITQKDSEIDMATPWFTAAGTLYVDKSLSCVMTSTTTSWGAQADMRISGAVAGNEGSRTLTLHLYFTAVTPEGDRCSLGATMNGTQVSK
jgi:hypothetical protein